MVCRLAPDALHAHIQGKLRTDRVPLSGTFELTRRCNFRCGHCYLGRKSPGDPEMDTETIERLLEEMARAGCLTLTLTGGEPLCRPDYREIHARAVELGLFVTVFTNAAEVDEELADFLAARPPRRLEVSLYGADADAYQVVTGAGENFSRALQGLDRLLERGLAVKLKALLLASLLPQVDRMQEMAAERGLPLRLDPGIDPTLTGDRGPCALRPEPGDAARAELSDPVAMAQYLDAQDAPERAGPCGAGVTGFHLDPQGRLMRCLQVREPSADAVQEGFVDAWRSLAQAERLAIGAHPACRACGDKNLCSFCPGLERLGERPGEDAYLCRVVRARAGLLASAGGAV